MLALEVEPSKVRAARALRMLFGANRFLSGGEIALPYSQLSSDGELLVGAVERLVDHPEDRKLLVDPGGPEAVRRLTAA